MSFKVIKSQSGFKHTVNLNNIDVIVFRNDGTAIIHVGSIQIVVTTEDALNLEVELGLKG